MPEGLVAGKVAGCSCHLQLPVQARCPLARLSLALLLPQDSAEFGKIGKYYAVESMLLWDPETQQYLVRRWVWVPRWLLACTRVLGGRGCMVTVPLSLAG